MNTYYHAENKIFKTKEEAEKFLQNYNIKRIDEIETAKSFEEFETAFDKYREEGNSILDSIEWAK